MCKRLLVEDNDGNCVHLTVMYLLYICLVDPNRTTKLLRIAINPVQDESSGTPKEIIKEVKKNNLSDFATSLKCNQQDAKFSRSIFFL